MEKFLKQLDRKGLFLVHRQGKLLLKSKNGNLSEEQKKQLKEDVQISNYIKEHKTALIEFLQRRKSAAVTYPLSPLQEGILFHHLFDEQEVYLEQLKVDFPKGISAKNLELAINYLTANHSILRTRFLTEKVSKPVQCVEDKVNIPVEVIDLSDFEPKERQKRYQEFLEADKRRNFDFSSAPLMRLHLLKMGQTEMTLVWTFHHILFDGWSLSNLLAELIYAYKAYSQGLQPRKVPEDRYQDYIQLISKNDSYEAERFWKSYLDGIKESSLLPFVTQNESNENKAGSDELVLSVSSQKTSQLKAYCQANQLTVNTLVQGLWSLLLSDYTNSKEVLFGVTVSGRPADLPRAEERVGLYINTIPFRARIEEDQDLVEWLQELQSAHSAARVYQYSALNTVQKWSGIEGIFFDNIIVFENYPVSETLKSSEKELQIGKVQMQEQTNFPLTLTVALQETLECSFIYRADVLNQAVVEMIKQRFSALLDLLVSEENLALHTLKNRVPEQEAQQLALLNDTSVSFEPKEQTLAALFRSQAKQKPHQTALIYGENQLTYQELDQRSDQLAACLLQTYGVKSEELIGVLMERSDLAIIAILGSLKAGAAFVPIDPKLPEARKDFIIEDIGAPWLLTDDKTATQNPALTHKTINLTSLNLEQQTVDTINTLAAVKPNASSLAYVIYTSGSTGQPKGAMIENGGIKNTILSLIQEFGISSADNCLQFASLSFDASIWEIFTALLAGASLHVVEEDVKADAQLFCDYVNAHNIHLTILPPSYVSTIDLEELRTLRTLITGGEAAIRETANAFQKKGHFYNAYGPTEASICATLFKLEKDQYLANDKVPIGKPLANTQIHILDSNEKVLGLGVVGELCIAGAGLARGYWNRPALTEEKFVQLKNGKLKGERIYKTGDLARWLPDGTIEFLGRKDDQVKIRGHRVELGEIISCINNIEEVEQSTVVAAKDAANTNQLIAYIIPKGVFEKTKIKEKIRQALPAYMVPNVLVELEQFPLTTSGKIDKKKLPLPPNSAIEKATYLAARNKTESDLADIWSAVLRQEQVGIRDNFFDLGGHSIIAIQLVSRIRNVLGARVSIKDLFSLGTIEALARQINQKEQTTALPDLVPLSPQLDKLPLSYQQERIWFIDQLMGSQHYHISKVSYFSAALDREALQQAFKCLLQRHTILRAVIREEEGQPFQILQATEDWQIDYEVDKNPLDRQGLEQKVRDTIEAPFDLTKDMLLRAKLIKLGQKGYVLVTVIHHIACDAWSSDILINELLDLYKGFHSGKGGLKAELPIQYTDYAHWQKQYLSGATLEQKLQYWEAKLKGAAPLKFTA